MAVTMATLSSAEMIQKFERPETNSSSRIFISCIRQEILVYYQSDMCQVLQREFHRGDTIHQ